MAAESTKQNLVERYVARFDSLQQRHHILGFPYAIIKKYGDDQAGYQAALIAYYGFISLFPLLIVATSVIQLITQNSEHFRDLFLTNVTSYFPLLGPSLTDSINTPSRSGIALVIGLLITLYGTRGLAVVIQHAQDHIWAVTRTKRAGFPKSLFKGFGIIAWGGLGFILAASLTGYAAAGQHFWLLRIILGLTGFTVLFIAFWGIFTFGSSARKHPFANIPGALFAAIGLLILQVLGGYLIGHQLRSQTGLNAQFAIVLALLFWLYLQAQVFLYAVELNTVRKHKLWPRSIASKPPLVADIQAYNFYKKRETYTNSK
jgi:YihY family inner membrane protein